MNCTSAGRNGFLRLTGAFLCVLLVGCGAAGEDRGGQGSAGAAAGQDTASWPDSVGEEVLRMEESDQRIRQEAVALMRSAPEPDSAAASRLVQEQDSVDRANTARLKEIIREHGWPSKARAGDEVARAAFTLVQHATHDLAFQKEYLAFLEAEHRAGGVHGEAVALLTDRTRQAEGKRQLYGTQMSLRAGKLVLDPIADSARVDERRAALGLVPLSEYLERLREAYGLPE